MNIKITLQGKQKDCCLEIQNSYDESLCLFTLIKGQYQTVGEFSIEEIKAALRKITYK